MLRERTFVTDCDRARLQAMLRTLAPPGNAAETRVREFDQQLRQAAVVPTPAVHRDVVTMNSRVRVCDLDSGCAQAFTLVYPGQSEAPGDCDVTGGRVSVLMPLGRALLGSRVGQVVTWRGDRGVRRMRIEEIPYQPEAAGDFGL